MPAHRSKSLICSVLLLSVLIVSCGGSAGDGNPEESDQDVVPTEDASGPTITNTDPPATDSGVVPTGVRPEGGETPDPATLLPGGGVAGDPDTATPGAFDGSRPSIANIYSDSQLAALESLGFQINEGDDPPNIEGAFRLERIIMTATSVPDDTLSNIAPADIIFRNQDNNSLTVDYELDQDNGDSALGSGSFISGSGNAFTVFFVSETITFGFAHDTTFSFSGIVTDAGIENAQFALFGIDDRGNPNVLATDTGRLFIDLDGFSERIGGVPDSRPITALPSGSATINPGTSSGTSDEADIPSSQLSRYEPLFGDVIFTVAPFAGGFFSHRAVIDASNVVDTNNDGRFNVVSINRAGRLACSAFEESIPTYLCIIENDLGQEVTMVVSFIGNEGFGNAVICLTATEDCSTQAVAFRLEQSPDGTASVIVNRTTPVSLAKHAVKDPSIGLGLTSHLTTYQHLEILNRVRQDF